MLVEKRSAQRHVSKTATDACNHLTPYVYVSLRYALYTLTSNVMWQSLSPFLPR